MHRRATAAERYAEVYIGKRAFLPGRTRSPAADEGDHVFPQSVGKKFRWTEPLLGRNRLLTGVSRPNPSWCRSERRGFLPKCSFQSLGVR